MKEALGRGIKPYDLVLVKRNGCKSEFRLALVYTSGNSVFIDENVDISYRTCYLLENPTEQELVIKNELMKELKHYLNKSEEHKNKILNNMEKYYGKEQKRGDTFSLYKTSENAKSEYYVYLGYCKLAEERAKDTKNKAFTPYKSYAEGYMYIALKDYELEQFIANPKKMDAYKLKYRLKIYKSKQTGNKKTLRHLNLPEKMTFYSGTVIKSIDIDWIKN